MHAERTKSACSNLLLGLSEVLVPSILGSRFEEVKHRNNSIDTIEFSHMGEFVWRKRTGCEPCRDGNITRNN